MFTGIIEEVGAIRSVAKGSKSAILTIEAGKVLEETEVGDSIAVNGVCLTVTKLQKDSFQADVMAETLRRSTLGELHHGSKVNLERAMMAGSRFGGHIVSGHIDGTGKIISMKKEDNAIWVEVEASEKILRLIIEKGSIAIDGISLTVAGLTNHSFSVSVIPHTGQETTLLQKKVGALVNLENDLIGKYVEHILSMKLPQEEDQEETDSGGITMEMLREYGF